MADPTYLDTAIQQVQTPEARAFLATLDGPESGGNYNIRFNGNTPATFDDMSRHPAVAVRIPEGWPMAGSTSDAAGAHQMLSSTWNRAAQRLGLPGAETGDAPYYPIYQDLGAWDVASTAFKQKNPGGDLLGALQSGNIEPVFQAMRDTHQWDTANPSAYFGNLAKRLQTAQGPTDTVSDARPAVPDVAAPASGDVIQMFINGTLPGMRPPQGASPGGENIPMDSPLGREIASAPPSGSPIPLDTPQAAAPDDPASHGAMPDVLTLTGRGTQPPDVIAKAQRIRAGEDPQTVLGYTIDKPAPPTGIDALAAAGTRPLASPSPGIAALAAAGTPTNAPPGAATMPMPATSPGITALANAGNGAGGAQNPPPVSRTIAAPAATPAPQGAVAAAPSASPTPMFDVPSLVQQYNDALRYPKGQAVAAGILALIEKQVPPGGYRIMSDGSMQLAPGVAEGAGQIKGAEAIAGAMIRPKLNADGTPALDATGRPTYEPIPGAPRKLQSGRPGSLVFDEFGNTVGATPTMIKVVDPQTGAETYQYSTPPGAPPINTKNTGNTSTGTPGAPPATAPATSPAAPGQNSQTGEGMPAALGPGQHAALVARGDAEQKQRQLVIDQANGAQTSQAGLQNMQRDIGGFTQGPFAQNANLMKSYLRLIFPGFDAPVADYEDFIKNAGSLTRTAVHDTSPRAAAQEYTMINATLPNADMSPMGLQRVTNELMGLNDFKTVKAQAQAKWEQDHGGIGNVSGFETDFQKNLSPYAFVMARMDPIDLKQMVLKLQASPEGQRQLSTMRNQLQYIKTNRLDQGLQ